MTYNKETEEIVDFKDKEVAEIKEIYVPKDKDIDRPRFWRAVVSGVGFALCFLVPGWFGYYLLTTVYDHGNTAIIGWCLGLFVGSGFAAKAMPYLTKYSDKWQALTTLDPLTGEMETYGPGLNSSFPWETVGKDDHMPLEIIYKEHTETYGTLDDFMTVKFGFFFLPDIRRIPTFRGVSEGTIDEGFTAILSNFLSGYLAGMSADDIRKKNDEIKETVKVQFGIGRHESATPNAADKEDLEEKYGVILVGFVVPDADYSVEYQQAKKAKARAQAQFEAVAEMFGMSPSELKAARTNNDISAAEYLQMFDRAMVNSKAATLQIHKIEGEGFEGVAEAASKLFGKNKGATK